jgi:hypothetical protein
MGQREHNKVMMNTIPKVFARSNQQTQIEELALPLSLT